jgi:hypothetical protein
VQYRYPARFQRFRQGRSRSGELSVASEQVAASSVVKSAGFSVVKARERSRFSARSQFRTRNGTAAMARTPVLPKVNQEGLVSAQLRRSRPWSCYIGNTSIPAVAWQGLSARFSVQVDSE